MDFVEICATWVLAKKLKFLTLARMDTAYTDFSPISSKSFKMGLFFNS